MTELEIAVLRTMERMDSTPAGKEVYATFMLHHRGTTISYEEITQAFTNLIKAGKLTAMGDSRPHFRYFLRRHN
jgi:O6-methylguanine-DNA--protein-cysteine methyltransferase